MRVQLVVFWGCKEWVVVYERRMLEIDPILGVQLLWDKTGSGALKEVNQADPQASQLESDHLTPALRKALV
jgi:hypothetical protein